MASLTWGRLAGVTGSGTGFMAAESLTASTRTGGGGEGRLIPGVRGGLEKRTHAETGRYDSGAGVWGHRTTGRGPILEV